MAHLLRRARLTALAFRLQPGEASLTGHQRSVRRAMETRAGLAMDEHIGTELWAKSIRVQHGRQIMQRFGWRVQGQTIIGHHRPPKSERNMATSNRPTADRLLAMITMSRELRGRIAHLLDRARLTV